MGVNSQHGKIFSEVLRNIESGILILDSEKKSLFFSNAHAEKILESLDIPANYEALCSVMADGLRDLADPVTRRSRQQMLRKEEHIVGYTAYRLHDDNRYLLLFVQDITERKRLDAIAEAVETSNNIGFIFSGIRHEIGNPLNSLKMALSVLRGNVDDFGKQDFLTYFDRMAGDIQKMESLLKAFKHYSMFEKPVITRLELEAFFKDFMDLIGTDFNKYGIEVNIELARNVRVVLADSRALNQVLFNLVANAKDAMEGHPHARLEIRGKARGDVVLLSVKDNGCGMAAEQMKHLFKPFHTSKTHGTGLGLVIAKKMLAQMNCSIAVESRNGEGTTVTLSLPRA